MNDVKQRRPGDLILDRYMPNATPEQREEARTNLRAYAAVLLEIGQRIAHADGDKVIGENRGSDVDSEIGANFPDV
jgi:hypothetical protein